MLLAVLKGGHFLERLEQDEDAPNQVMGLDLLLAQRGD
jgi:hypothetical protein